MRTALFITSISALVASIAALLLCALLLVAMVRLGVDVQSLSNVPVQVGGGVLVP